MGLNFESKAIDITLTIKGMKGATKTFEPREKVTAAFCTRIGEEIKLYAEAQKSLPEKEQDSIIPGCLKQLSWIYKDFDIDWCNNNIANKTEIVDIYSMVVEAMNGVKKEDKS